jgi:hypothetical protein
MLPDSGTIVCILDGLEKCKVESDTKLRLKTLVNRIGQFYSTNNHKVYEFCATILADVACRFIPPVCAPKC